MENSESWEMKKLKVGIPGFDFIADGGLPLGRATLIAGTAGSSKTIFCTQFLIEGIKAGSAAVFVTFEESPEEIRRNMKSFGWDIARWESEGKWAFVDASPHLEEETEISGSFELRPLLSRIQNAVKKTNANRLSIDSLGTVFVQFEKNCGLRRELLKLFTGLKKLEVTTVITAERTEDYGRISTTGVEEFVADNVIIFRNVLQEETRRRTIEILKFRGAPHHKGEYPFTIVPKEGMVVIPLASISLEQTSSDIRVSSGNALLDRMCGGGFFRDSVTLASGATGTGKTLMATEFLSGGFGAGEKALFFAFEESREQLLRNALGWGVDFVKMEKEGRLLITCVYPEAKGLEDHLMEMKKQMLAFKPNRIAVDSLSALERVSNLKTFREFVIGLTSFIKECSITGFFTSATSALMGGTSITEAHISTITDAIVLLRYVELQGEMRRGITVLKMRGSYHDKEIREYSITKDGMHIGRPFHNVTGIISGNQVAMVNSEIARLNEMFESGGEA